MKTTILQTNRDVDQVKIRTTGAALAALLALGLSGCCSSPFVEKTRMAAKAMENVSFQAIQDQPASYEGSMVIWGGRVIKTVNKTTGSSLYVLQLPLDKCYRPRPDGYSEGRFLVKSTAFLDPEMLSEGQLVTVAGHLQGQETEPLEEIQYSYPVINLEELQAWSLAPNYPDYYWSTWRSYYRPRSFGWYGMPQHHQYRYFHGGFHQRYHGMPLRVFR